MANLKTKIIRSIVVISFLFNQVPADLFPMTADPKLPELSLSLSQFSLPSEIGTIQKVWNGASHASNRWVIHIQDLHADYGAQKNIAQILRSLYLFLKANDPERIKSGLLLAVEGAQGVVDPRFFSAFPDLQVREDTADYFMKKAEFTGPEFFSMIHPDWNVELFGIEDKDLYLENKEAYSECAHEQEKWKDWFGSVKTRQLQLEKDLSIQVQEFLTHRADYDSGKEKFADYAQYLKRLAHQFNIALEDFPNLELLDKFELLQKSVDPDQVERERNQSLEALSQKLPQDELKPLVKKSLEYRLGRIGADEYFLYFSEVLGDKALRDYSQLSRYIEMSRVHSKMDPHATIDELTRLQKILTGEVFETSEEKAFLEFQQAGELIEKWVGLKMTREDLEAVKTLKDRLADIFAHVGLELPGGFESFEKFYKTAQKRDHVLFDKTLARMREKHKDLVVLVTGGFHTPELTRFFEEGQIPYTVITPSTQGVPQITEELYRSRMMGQIGSLDQMILSRTKTLHPGSFLAPLMADDERSQSMAQAVQSAFGLTAGSLAVSEGKNIGEILQEWKHQFEGLATFEFSDRDLKIGGTRLVLARREGQTFVFIFSKDAQSDVPIQKADILEQGVLRDLHIQVARLENLDLDLLDPGVSSFVQQFQGEKVVFDSKISDEDVYRLLQDRRFQMIGKGSQTKVYASGPYVVKVPYQYILLGEQEKKLINRSRLLKEAIDYLNRYAGNWAVWISLKQWIKKLIDQLKPLPKTKPEDVIRSTRIASDKLNDVIVPVRILDKDRLHIAEKPDPAEVSSSLTVILQQRVEELLIDYVKEAARTGDFEKAKSLIHKAVEFQLNLWKRGVIDLDSGMNIFENLTQDANGNILLVDTSMISDQKGKALHFIERRGQLARDILERFEGREMLGSEVAFEFVNRLHERRVHDLESMLEKLERNFSSEIASMLGKEYLSLIAENFTEDHLNRTWGQELKTAVTISGAFKSPGTGSVSAQAPPNLEKKIKTIQQHLKDEDFKTIEFEVVDSLDPGHQDDFAHYDPDTKKIKVLRALWEKIEKDEEAKFILRRHEYVENVLIPFLVEKNLLVLKGNDEAKARQRHPLTSAVDTVQEKTAYHALMKQGVGLMTTKQLESIKPRHWNDPNGLFYQAARDELGKRLKDAETRMGLSRRWFLGVGAGAVIALASSFVWFLSRPEEIRPTLPGETASLPQSTIIRDPRHQEVIDRVRTIYQRMPVSPGGVQNRGRLAVGRLLEALEDVTKNVVINDDPSGMGVASLLSVSGKEIKINYTRVIGKSLPMLEVICVHEGTHLEENQKQRYAEHLRLREDMRKTTPWAQVYDRFRSDENFRANFIRMIQLYWGGEVDATRAELEHIAFVRDYYPEEIKNEFRNDQGMGRYVPRVRFINRASSSVSTNWVMDERRHRLVELGEYGLSGPSAAYFSILLRWEMDNGRFPRIDLDAFMRDIQRNSNSFFWDHPVLSGPFREALLRDDSPFMEYLLNPRATGPFKIPGKIKSEEPQIGKLGIMGVMNFLSDRYQEVRMGPIGNMPKGREGDFAYSEMDEKGGVKMIRVRQDLWERIKNDPEAQRILRRHEYIENILIPSAIYAGYLKKEDQSRAHAITSQIDALLERTSVHALMKHVLKIMKDDELDSILPEHWNDPDGKFFEAVQSEIMVRKLISDIAKFTRRYDFYEGEREATFHVSSFLMRGGLSMDLEDAVTQILNIVTANHTPKAAEKVYVIQLSHPIEKYPGDNDPITHVEIDGVLFDANQPVEPGKTQTYVFDQNGRRHDESFIRYPHGEMLLEETLYEFMNTYGLMTQREVLNQIGEAFRVKTPIGWGEFPQSSLDGKRMGFAVYGLTRRQFKVRGFEHLSAEAMRKYGNLLRTLHEVGFVQRNPDMESISIGRRATPVLHGLTSMLPRRSFTGTQDLAYLYNDLRLALVALEAQLKTHFGNFLPSQLKGTEVYDFLNQFLQGYFKMNQLELKPSEIEEFLGLIDQLGPKVGVDDLSTKNSAFNLLKRFVSGKFAPVNVKRGLFKVPGTGIEEAQGVEQAKIDVITSRLNAPDYENLPIKTVERLSGDNVDDFAHLQDGDVLVKQNLWERIQHLPNTQKILRRHEYVENVLIPRLVREGVLEEGDLQRAHALASAVDTLEEGTAFHDLMKEVLPLMSVPQLQAIQAGHPNDPRQEFYQAVQAELKERSRALEPALEDALVGMILTSDQLKEMAERYKDKYPDLARSLRGLAREVEYIEVLGVKEKNVDKGRYHIYRARDKNGIPIDLKLPRIKLEVETPVFEKGPGSLAVWLRLISLCALLVPFAACGTLSRPLLQTPAAVTQPAPISIEAQRHREMIELFRGVLDRMPVHVDGIANPGRPYVERFVHALDDGVRRVRVVNTPEAPSAEMGSALLQTGPDEITLNFLRLREHFDQGPIWIEIAAVHEAEHLEHAQELRELAQVFDSLFPGDVQQWRAMNYEAYWRSMMRRLRTEPEFESRMRRYSSLIISLEAQARLAQFQHMEFIRAHYPVERRAGLDGSRALRDFEYSREDDGRISLDRLWLTTLDLNGFRGSWPDPFYLLLQREMDRRHVARFGLDRFRRWLRDHHQTYFWEYSAARLRSGRILDLMMRGRLWVYLAQPSPRGAFKVPGVGPKRVKSPPRRAVKLIQDELHSLDSKTFENIPFEIVDSLGEAYSDDFAHYDPATGKIKVIKELWQGRGTMPGIEDDPKAQRILRRHEYVENVLIRRLRDEKKLRLQDGRSHALASWVDAAEEGTPMHALMEFVIPLMSESQLKAIQLFHPNDPKEEFYSAVQTELKNRQGEIIWKGNIPDLDKFYLKKRFITGFLDRSLQNIGELRRRPGAVEVEPLNRPQMSLKNVYKVRIPLDTGGSKVIVVKVTNNLFYERIIAGWQPYQMLGVSAIARKLSDMGYYPKLGEAWTPDPGMTDEGRIWIYSEDLVEGRDLQEILKELYTLHSSGKIQTPEYQEMRHRLLRLMVKNYLEIWNALDRKVFINDPYTRNLMIQSSWAERLDETTVRDMLSRPLNDMKLKAWMIDLDVVMELKDPAEVLLKLANGFSDNETAFEPLFEGVLDAFPEEGGRLLDQVFQKLQTSRLKYLAYNDTRFYTQDLTKRFKNGLRRFLESGKAGVPLARRAMKLPGTGPAKILGPIPRDKIDLVRSQMKANEYINLPIDAVDDLGPGHENDLARFENGRVLVRRDLFNLIYEDVQALTILRRHEYVENVVIPKLVREGKLQADDLDQAHRLTSAVDADLEYTPFHSLMRYTVTLMSQDQLLAISMDHPNDPNQEFYKAVRGELAKRILVRGIAQFQREDEEVASPGTVDRFRALASRIHTSYVNVMRAIQLSHGNSKFVEKDVTIEDPSVPGRLNIDDIDVLEQSVGMGEKKTESIVGEYRPYRKRVANAVGAQRLGIRQAYGRLLQLVQQKMAEREGPVVVRIGGRPGTGKTTIADAIGQYGLGLILPSEVSVLHADSYHFDFEYMAGKLEEEKAKGKKLIILEGTFSLKGLANRFQDDVPRIAPDVNVFVELHEDNRIQRLYQRAEKRDRDWVDMISTKFSDLGGILHYAEKFLPSDLEKQVRDQVEKAELAKGKKEKETQSQIARALLVRNLRVMRENETRSMFDFERVENFIHRYTIDQERATADLIIKNDHLSADFGIFSENANLSIRTGFERIIQGLKGSDHEHVINSLVNILRSYSDHLIVLKIEDLIQNRTGVEQRLSGLGSEELQGKITEFLSQEDNVAQLSLLLDEGMRIVSSKKAPGEDDLSAEEILILQNIVNQGSQRLIKNEEWASSGVAQILNSRSPPENYQEEHDRIVQAINTGEEVLLSKPVRLEEKFFDSARVEVHAVKTGDVSGFRLPGRSRPIYEWTEVVEVDGKAVIRVYLTEAFLKAHQTQPAIVAQALIHPLVENIAGRTHLEAVQHESFYSADSEKRKDANAGRAVMSDFTQWVIDEAAREGDWNYLERRTHPWQADLARYPHLHRNIIKRAYRHSVLVNERVWQNILSHPDFISAILKETSNGRDLFLFVLGLLNRRESIKPEWIKLIIDNPAVEADLIKRISGFSRLEPSHRELLLQLYEKKLLDVLKLRGIHLEMPAESLSQNDRIDLLSTLSRFPDWLKEINPQVVSKKGALGLFEVRKWLAKLNLGTRGLRRRLYERFWHILAFNVYHVWVYGKINEYTATIHVTRDLTTPLDKWIPLFSPLILPYLSFYIFIILPGFLVPTVKNFRRAVAAYYTALTTLFIAFLVFPVRMIRPTIDPEVSVFHQLVHWFYQVDLPYNSTPSPHATLSFLTGIILLKMATHRGRFIHFIIAVTIGLSTLFIKQHYVADVLSGWLVAYLSYKIWFSWSDRWMGWIKNGLDVLSRKILSLRRIFAWLKNRLNWFNVSDIERYPSIRAGVDVEGRLKRLSRLEISVDTTPVKKNPVYFKSGKIHMHPDALKKGERAFFSYLYNVVLEKISRVPTLLDVKPVQKNEKLERKLGLLKSEDVVSVDASVLNVLGGEDRLRGWFEELGLDYSYAELKAFLDEWQIYFVVEPGPLVSRPFYQVGDNIYNDEGNTLFEKGDILLNWGTFDFMLTRAAMIQDPSERDKYYRAAFGILVRSVHGYMTNSRLPGRVREWIVPEEEEMMHVEKAARMVRYFREFQFDEVHWDLESGKIALRKDKVVVSEFEISRVLKDPARYEALRKRWIDRGFKKVVWQGLPGVRILLSLRTLLKGPPLDFTGTFESKIFKDPRGTDLALFNVQSGEIHLLRYTPDMTVKPAVQALGINHAEIQRQIESAA